MRPSALNTAFMPLPLFYTVDCQALSACADLAEPDTNREHDAAADNNLDDGVDELTAHEVMADAGD
jgi:hypothetical protein